MVKGYKDDVAARINDKSWMISEKDWVVKRYKDDVAGRIYKW